MVAEVGLEPTSLSRVVLEATAYANFATQPYYLSPFLLIKSHTRYKISLLLGLIYYKGVIHEHEYQDSFNQSLDCILIITQYFVLVKGF